MKTILELSREIGVSKTAVYKKIDKLRIRNKLTRHGNKILIDEKCEKLIKSAFDYADDTATQTDDDFANLIQQLSRQLEIKDKQIEALNNTVSKLTDEIAVNHKMLLAYQQKEQLSIEAKDAGQTTTEQTAGASNHVSWWRNLFHKGG